MDCMLLLREIQCTLVCCIIVEKFMVVVVVVADFRNDEFEFSGIVNGNVNAT